jgi:hypothetical protein
MATLLLHSNCDQRGRPSPFQAFIRLHRLLALSAGNLLDREVVPSLIALAITLGTFQKYSQAPPSKCWRSQQAGLS